MLHISIANVATFIKLFRGLCKEWTYDAQENFSFPVSCFAQTSYRPASCRLIRWFIRRSGHALLCLNKQLGISAPGSLWEQKTYEASALGQWVVGHGRCLASPPFLVWGSCIDCGPRLRRWCMSAHNPDSSRHSVTLLRSGLGDRQQVYQWENVYRDQLARGRAHWYRYEPIAFTSQSLWAIPGHGWGRCCQLD